MDLTPNMSAPLKSSTKSRVSWKADWHRMLRLIGREMRLAVRLYGFLSSAAVVGASVPRARAPMVSMIKFT
jgi:hypothetical protein